MAADEEEEEEHVGAAAEDEFGLADLDLDDDWDPVQGTDSSRHQDRSACPRVLFAVNQTQSAV